jgi:hypothetical protein
VIIVIGGMTTFVSSEMDKTQTGNLGQARILGEKIATAINTVYNNGNGYSVNLTIPMNSNITASVNNTTGKVDILYLPSNKGLSVKFIPKNIQNFIMSSQTTKDNIYAVTNINGTITFTQVG